MTQTVLITGGSGFLGSHTADALSAAGYKVRIFDREESPYLSGDQEMVLGEITDADAVMKAAKGCDYIYHIAGIADLEEAKQNPIGTCQVNIMGTLNALEAAKANNVKRFVFSSTIYVYSCMGGFYRVSKQACENYIEEYQKTFGVPYTILRYGSLYGRRAGAENGINRIIQSAIDTGEIIYNGNPDSVREYIHVNDAAKLSVKILEEEYTNRHLMLTGQNRMRVVDLMQMISEMMPNKPKITFGDHTLEAHYVMTPYNYNPKLANKMTSNDHIELGQGLLDCIDALTEKET